MSLTSAGAETGAALLSAEIAADGLRMTLGNTLESIEQGRLEIHRFLSSAALGDRIWNRLELVFEEIIANIVRHGFTPGSGQIILVTVRNLEDCVELAFEDDGVPFNPLDVAAPARAASLDDVKIGGLGIPLVQSFAQSAEYYLAPGTPEAPFAASGRERNRLTVKIAKS